MNDLQKRLAMLQQVVVLFTLMVLVMVIYKSKDRISPVTSQSPTRKLVWRAVVH
jgi:hypothetical protein